MTGNDPMLKLTLPLLALVACASLTACKRPIPPSDSEVVQQTPTAPPGPTVKSLSAGGDHTCAVTTDGRLLCWGAYASDGITEPGQPRPVQVGSMTDWKLAAAGSGLTCAIKDNGSLWCFASYAGALLSASRTALGGGPIRIGSGTDLVEVSVGGAGVCTLRGDASVACVGRKEIVDAEKFDHPVSDEALQPVAGVSDVRSISTGLATSCAVRTNGELWCWGRIGRTLSAPPEQIGTRTDWQQVHLNGLGGCAARTDGKVYCWEKDVGQATPTPIILREPGDAHSLTVGSGHQCARTESGWQCWGDFRAGQRGPDASATTASPAPRFDDWTLLSAGGRHTCGVREGHAYCWGENTFGELGNGASGGSRDRPTALAADTAFRHVGPSVYHACGIAEDGSLYCWGSNEYGQLGTKSAWDAATPRPVLGDAAWTDVAVNGIDTCAVRTDGTLWCWGAQYGKRPRQMAEGRNWREVDMATRTCATQTDGSLWCWSKRDESSPTQLAQTGWTGPISVGIDSVCGLLDDRTAHCIEFGSGNDNARSFVVASGTWKDFAAEGSTACGVREDGSGWCVEPFDGERPSPMYAPPRLEPLDPTNPDARWKSLSVTRSHSCAIRTDGSLWCWGSDRAGALGLGPDVRKAKTPQRVDEQKWSFVTVGEETTCGITDGGALHCWGRHYVVGDGEWLNPNPQAIVAPENMAAS